MTPIDAIKDPRIATARSPATRAGRDAAGLCLVEGPSLIRQAQAAGARLAYVLTSVDAAGDDPSLDEELRDARVPVHTVREGLLRKITGGARPVDWLAVAHLPTPLRQTDPYGDFAVVCEWVAGPGNLDTIVRTARALGVQDVVLTDGTTDLVGNETEGVSDTVQALADLVVQIPMAGAVESLNVGVATGISRGHVAVAADDAADLIITAEGKQAIAALWAV
ncbi:rRNA methylase [Streptomyces noursei ATCC 11455]|uniref:TrmH family RNA methyltransferase n=1 Tax=Streptomyces noursei TaxID=1971 RepID=UPI00081D19E8|nr:rRNA methylase [Streptomyces noursei ATCC 11455]